MKLEVIWSLYQHRLKAFLDSKVSNPSDAEDLLQEIFIKIHNNIVHLKKESSVKSWLFQIANRTVIDFYRKKSVADKIENDDLWYGDSEKDVMADLSYCIEPFLHALPSEMANVLRSVDLDGMSQISYAKVLNMNYSTLKSRVQIARAELKALFASCCAYSVDQKGKLIDFEYKSHQCKYC